MDDNDNKEIRFPARTLYGPDGKRISQRKQRKASRAIMEAAIMSKLYEDQFISKIDDTTFFFDMSSKIERVYGKEPKSTGSDIRDIMRRMIRGFESQGNVRIKILSPLGTTIWSGKVQENTEDGDGELQSKEIEKKE